MIKMQVIGNLGRDCLVNNVNGRNVINFTVAHTERYRDSQGNNQERTTWVECAWWTDRTTVSQYLTKGKQVYVEGQPDVRSFTRNDGTAGAALILRVRELQLLGGRGDAATAPATTPTEGTSASDITNTSSSNASSVNDFDEPVDDLPF
ncbi:Single-stranded DNA-binding protein [Mycovorax composti]|jgi:single stranded DNA-binding protein (ssb)|uniref:Single-stranded DNA-binding protein n=2 Tax=Chitinophagaceae TaxID=563835 RepID=A0ABZ2EFT2_9BACT